MLMMSPMVKQFQNSSKFYIEILHSNKNILSITFTYLSFFAVNDLNSGLFLFGCLTVDISVITASIMKKISSG